MIEVAVLHKDPRTWIFQRTDRGMPSASIQGEALSQLLSQLAIGLSALEDAQVDTEARAELQDAFDYLWGIQEVYQRYGGVDPPSRKPD